MIVCQRFLKSFRAARCCIHLKPAHCSLEKYCFSHRNWNFSGAPLHNLSIYCDDQLSHSRPTDIEVPHFQDMYLHGDLDGFLLNYKDALYENTEDSFVKILKECRVASDVLKIIDQIDSPTSEQLVQAVLTLRGLQKFLENNQLSTNSDFVSKFRDFQASLESSSFKKLVESIVDHSHQLNLDELTFCMLYLHRFNVPKETLMTLVNSFVNVLNNSEETHITEAALARAAIVLKDLNDLSSFYIMKDIVPIVFNKLGKSHYGGSTLPPHNTVRFLFVTDSCSDFETFGKLTVCLQKMIPILSADSLKRFIEKSRFLLQRNDDIEIECNRARTVLKAVLLLCYKTWRSRFSSYEKELLMSLSGSVKYLSVLENAILYDVN